jgi:hypothetical protein
MISRSICHFTHYSDVDINDLRVALTASESRLRSHAAAADGSVGILQGDKRAAHAHIQVDRARAFCFVSDGIYLFYSSVGVLHDEIERRTRTYKFVERVHYYCSVCVFVYFVALSLNCWAFYRAANARHTRTCRCVLYVFVFEHVCIRLLISVTLKNKCWSFTRREESGARTYKFVACVNYSICCFVPSTFSHKCRRVTAVHAIA